MRVVERSEKMKISGFKTIRVSQQVYDILMSIKARHGHATLDSVVRWLLERSGFGFDPGVCEFMASGRLCRLKDLKERCDQEKWWLCKLRAKAMEMKNKGSRKG